MPTHPSPVTASNAVQVTTHVKARDMHASLKEPLVQSTSCLATGLQTKTPLKAGRQLGKPKFEDEARGLPGARPKPTTSATKGHTFG
jgi:hypothetical protein